MKHFLDPTAEPSPPARKVRYAVYPGVVIFAVSNAQELAEALNGASMGAHRYSQCCAGMVLPAIAESARMVWCIAPTVHVRELCARFYPHLTKDLLLVDYGRSVKATLAVLRAQIARLTDITEWEEVPA